LGGDPDKSGFRKAQQASPLQNNLHYVIRITIEKDHNRGSYIIEGAAEPLRLWEG